MTLANSATVQKSHRKESSFSGFQYYSAHDYKNLLRRRSGMIVTVALMIALLISAIAYLLPNVYKASTEILVDPGKVPETYVKSTATIDANQRLAILQEQILSTPKLGQIIDELELYPGLRKTKSQEDIVAMMKKHITVEATRTEPPVRALKAFAVSFSAPNALLAAKVSNRIASLFIEENLKVREQQVLGTAEFFDQELQTAKQDLDEKAEKLAQLRARYSSDLPESQNLHLQALNSAQLALREEIDVINRAKEQKASLQSVLADSPNVVNLDDSNSTANTGLQEQLERSEVELEQLRTRYGPSYPDVLSKQADIRSLEQKLKDVAAQQSSVPASSRKHHNPAIEGQIAQLDDETKKHETRAAELNSQIKFHESAMQHVPAAEQELASASNDLAIASDRYKRLEDHKFGADMSSDVEARQEAERFVLLDPAQPPNQPEFPNRPLIDAGGAAAGLGIALFLAVLLELLDPSVKTERELREQYKVPIFGEIPTLSTQSRSRKKKVWKALMVTGNLVLASGYAGLIFLALK